MAQIVANSMDEQVASCCDLILSIAVVFNNPVIREEIIVCTVKSLDKSNYPNIAEIIDFKNEEPSVSSKSCILISSTCLVLNRVDHGVFKAVSDSKTCYKKVILQSAIAALIGDLPSLLSALRLHFCKLPELRNFTRTC